MSLGKGKFAIVKVWKDHHIKSDGIQIEEWCETSEEGFEFISKQKKSQIYKWDVMEMV